MARILLVEDEPLVRELAFEDLSEAGHDVAVARDGDEALEMLHADRAFDLLFTDVKMPSSIDVELAAEARRLIPNLKVIYGTGLADDAGRMQPGERFLQKPYRRDVLLQMLDDFGLGA